MHNIRAYALRFNLVPRASVTFVKRLRFLRSSFPFLAPSELQFGLKCFRQSFYSIVGPDERSRKRFSSSELWHCLKVLFPFNQVHEEVSLILKKMMMSQLVQGTWIQHRRFQGELVKLAKVNLGAFNINSRNTLGNIYTLHLNGFVM